MAQAEQHPRDQDESLSPSRRFGRGDVCGSEGGVVRHGHVDPEGGDGGPEETVKAAGHSRVTCGASARPSRQPARGEEPEATSIRAACNAQAEVRRDEGPDGRGVTERQGGIE